MLIVTHQNKSGTMIFMDSLGAKIKAARLNAGLKQQALADKLGVTRNAVSLWESDKNGPAMATLIKLAQIIPIKIDGVQTSTPVDIPSGGMAVMGEVRAGAWLEIDGDSEPTETVPVAPDQRYRSNRQYALRVVGTSMNRVAAPGIYVVVADWSDNGSQLKDGDLVVVRRERAHTYEVTLKRAKKGAETWELWPESDDPKHQEPIAMTDGDHDVEVTVVGKVIGKYEPL